jgi:TPR repeat protein
LIFRKHTENQEYERTGTDRVLVSLCSEHYSRGMPMPGRHLAVLALIFCLAAFARQPLDSVVHAGLSEAKTAYDKGDFVKAHDEFETLAEQGNADAQWNLGTMDKNGNGVPQDYAEAVKWFRKAAEQGFAGAQYDLGVMYYGGTGVPQDYAEALKWFGKAAEQGFAGAQYVLGVMYVDGIGVERNLMQAHICFNLAATGGNPEAAAGRDRAASMMTASQISEAQRIAEEWKPKAGD